MSFSRRQFLQSTGAMGAALGAGGLLPTFGTGVAQAANTSGYRALVCVFFKGGMDGHDVLLPYDQGSYNRYAEIRSEMLGGYEGGDGTSSRQRANLLQLDPLNSADFGSRAFALSPDLAPLHDLFVQGQASIVANVGPLLQPMNRDQYRNDRSLAPPRLFSHNDQQSTWMALSPEGERIGWGGRFADVMVQANANQIPIFTAISVNSTDVFLAGNVANQYRITPRGSVTIDPLNDTRRLGPARNSETAQGLMREHFLGGLNQRDSLFQRDMVTVSQRAVENNNVFQEAFTNPPELLTQFPDTRLGQNLAAVARTISLRSQLQVNRQVFFVSIGGFDTHSGQANSLPASQRQFSEAIAAFYQSTVEMGIANDVTTFTASDFGRTLAVNGDGTDHGWGGNQFVVGGAVNGGQILGTVPEYDLDHQLDSGRGRMIPTTSIEQFAAPLGRWFGLSDVEVNTALPTLRNFTDNLPLI